MRAIFCGNFEFDARQSDLERLFRRYGKVDRVDMKSGFAFIYMEDERDGEGAIRALDRKEFGRKGRPLRVEWTKQERGQQERGIRRPGNSKRSANTRPSKTLFVINFDPYNTSTRDLERHFDPYGKIVNVRIRKNFAFVQFELQEDATRAFEATNMSKLTDRVISVEYSVRDDDKKNGYSPRDRSLEGGHDKRRSPSPYRRERSSPDYGRGRIPSPYKRERASPDYGHHRSPSPYRRDRALPEYGRRPGRSPYRREKGSPDNGCSPRRIPYQKERAGPEQGRAPSCSPYKRAGASSGHRAGSRSPYGRERVSPEHNREPSGSPYGRERVSPEHNQEPSGSPYGRERPSPGHGRDRSTSPYGRKKSSPDLDNGPSGSPYQREKAMANDDIDASPNVRFRQGDSPVYDGDESPAHERYRSQSPPMREISQSD